jgi:hypothetical protein
VTSTLKFKVVNESVKKTDRHDAATIAEFGLRSCLPFRFWAHRRKRRPGFPLQFLSLPAVGLRDFRYNPLRG